MNIVITTMLWKRHELFEVWAMHIHRLVNSFPDYNISVIVAGSEGNESFNLVKGFGFYYIEVPNKPLGYKANIRLKACKVLKPDCVILLGSDDFINNKTFKYITDKIKEGFDEVAPLDLYVYDTITKRLVYSMGYTNHRKGEQLAIGRALSREVLEGVDWWLWDSFKNRGLDGLSRDRLKEVVKNPHYYKLKDNDLFMVDVKTKVNLSPFKIRENHRIVSPDLFKLKEYPIIKQL